jgi:hypothetical protein
MPSPDKFGYRHELVKIIELIENCLTRLNCGPVVTLARCQWFTQNIVLQYDLAGLQILPVNGVLAPADYLVARPDRIDMVHYCLMSIRKPEQSRHIARQKSFTGSNA